MASFFYLKLSLARCQPHLFLSPIGNDLSMSLSNGTLLAVLIVFYTCNTDFDLSGNTISINDPIDLSKLIL
jgi:hypothetical protein